MLAKIRSSTLLGIDAMEVSVEVDASPGLPGETIVGLPDTVVKESRNRIKAALKHSGFEYPVKFYTINLAPAEIAKEGAFLDLPIAVGILQATGQVDTKPDSLFVGELSLDGEVKPIRGMISICQMAVQKGVKRVFFPEQSVIHTDFFPELLFYPMRSLKEMFQYLRSDIPPPVMKRKEGKRFLFGDMDFEEVKGQFVAKRVAEIAAAGGHNVLFCGPPGSGKTMIIQRFPTILPDMDREEAIETFKIHNVAQNGGKHSSFYLSRPFRAPHHSISYAGLVCGGENPRPGEISLAHNGVLFLDELPEFPRNVVEVLRQPLEEKKVTICRAACSIHFPARFMLLAAMNPCPCGYFGDQKQICQCHSSQIQKYWKKVSGPLLDRIDLYLEVPRVRGEDFNEQSDSHANSFSSEKMKKRISQSRQIQAIRFGRVKTNSDMNSREVEKSCFLAPPLRTFLNDVLEKGILTARSYQKVLKVARTIADLDQKEGIEKSHLSEALQYRKFR